MVAENVVFPILKLVCLIVRFEALLESLNVGIFADPGPVHAVAAGAVPRYPPVPHPPHPDQDRHLQPEHPQRDPPRRVHRYVLVPELGRFASLVGVKFGGNFGCCVVVSQLGFCRPSDRVGSEPARHPLRAVRSDPFVNGGVSLSTHPNTQSESNPFFEPI